jgi:hypothetical protein
MSAPHKKCGCAAIINEKDPRAEIWKEVFGQLVFPLKHPVPFQMSTFPGKMFVAGDPAALSEEEKEKLKSAMASKFGVPKEEIQKSIDDGLIPILFENIGIKICDLHIRCML